MRSILLLAFAGLAFSNSALACEGPDDFSGKAAAEAILDGSLSCVVNGKAVAAEFGVWAKFRCANSPVYATIEIAGDKQNVAAVTQGSPTLFQIETKAGARLTCALKKPNVSEDVLSKAADVASDLYEKIVGQSGERKYDLVSSKTTKTGKHVVADVVYNATMKHYNSTDTSPYTIRVKVLDGNVVSVTLTAAL